MNIDDDFELTWKECSGFSSTKELAKHFFIIAKNSIIDKNPTIRQRYKMTALERYTWAEDDDFDRVAILCGQMADAMIAEDEQHEDRN